VEGFGEADEIGDQLRAACRFAGRVDLVEPGTVVTIDGGSVLV
jgi:hypothetical protein